MQLRQNKMEFKILEDKKNPLLNRREMKLEIKEQIIPSKDKVKEELALKYSVDKELIEIQNISGKFGVKVFSIIVKIYDSLDEKNKIILKSRKQRDAEAKALADAKKAQEGATQ